MIVEVAKTQDDEVGDGTTTAGILAGELLKNAEALLEQGIHPTVIANGYRMASIKAKDILKNNQKLVNYPWSSYSKYISGVGPKWLKKEYVLSYFKSIQGYGFSSYQGFVEGYKEKSEVEDDDIFKKLLLD